MRIVSKTKFWYKKKRKTLKNSVLYAYIGILSGLIWLRTRAGGGLL
jgi:hypothetical protein